MTALTLYVHLNCLVYDIKIVFIGILLYPLAYNLGFWKAEEGIELHKVVQQIKSFDNPRFIVVKV